MSNQTIVQAGVRERPRLAAVRWQSPSQEPDTTDLDQAWFDGPRHSMIAIKAQPALASASLDYDVWDSPYALLVLVELPGVATADVSLSLGSQALHLEVSSSSETRVGALAKTHEIRFEVPPSSGPDTIDASLRNGLLRIRVKKGAPTRRIPITDCGSDE